MDKKELHNNIIYALTAADSVIESINILGECGIYIDKAEPFKDVLAASLTLKKFSLMSPLDRLCMEISYYS